MPVDEENLIFDLDGTLFNSAPQIIDCFRIVLANRNIETKNEITDSIIGPPIKETLEKLIQIEDKGKIDRLIEDFIELYDHEYCYRTKLYAGVRETLTALHRKKNLILITNKRLSPTVKMLKSADIMKFFDNYFSVDPNDKSKRNKAVLIAETIKSLKIDSENSVYIGDTESDYIASKENNIKFAFASWGYGELNKHADIYLKDIRELM